MNKVFLEIAIILVTTKIGGILSKRFKMPQVLGAMLAGILIGPSILGIVHESEDLKLLADLGVVMLMFSAGLETDFNKLKAAGKSSLFIALGGIALPLIFGTLTSFLFFNDFWENLFIGVILTATSVSITVQTLNELGKLNSTVGMNIVGSAVIDDILGLLIISFVIVLSQSSKSGNSADIATNLLQVSTKVLVFCIAAIGAVVFLPKLFDRYSKKIGKSQRIVVFAISMALIFAYLSEELGIAAITGAYICGLCISPITHKEYIERRVNTISSYLLTPIFFASIGIAVNLRDIKLEILGFTIVMCLVAIIGKILGCSLPARLFGISRKESLQIGIGMISRGEVALITTKLGLKNGIISNALFVPTLIVVVVTTIITPVLLKYSYTHKIIK